MTQSSDGSCTLRLINASLVGILSKAALHKKQFIFFGTQFTHTSALVSGMTGILSNSFLRSQT
ncbi:hypothetical protein HanRHA438_Chr16g0758031 [Helianthus annuus]|nr:hypothetical protein HanRHA438_Chr16g0758031 [Helianthus annuus]